MSKLSIEEIREFFSHDYFATNCLGAHIDEFVEGDREHPYKSVVSMDIDPSKHLNAQGFLMGGVTLALTDFALAVCGNANQVPSCSVNHTCEMMNRCKGQRLIAKAQSVKNGRALGFYRIDIYDELGTHVASATATTMKTPGAMACGE